MALSTYAQLQTAIGDFLDREDLLPVVSGFIVLAEARIARDLDHWRQEKRVETVLDERYEQVPDDMIQMLSLQHKDGGRIVTLSSAEMQERRGKTNDQAGKPCYVRLTAGQIELYPTPDESYDVSLLYRGRIPALSDTNTSTWLLDLALDVMLYGALTQTAPYLHDDARIQTWAALYQSSVDALNAESKEATAVGPMRLGVPR